MDLSSISVDDYDKARELIKEIQEEANELENKIYQQKKKLRILASN